MKNTVCFFATITALLLAASNLYGQSITTRMDSEFNTEFRNGLLIGNLLVAEKGKVIYQGSFGLRDIAAHQPNTPASAFALASVSKQLTATAVLQLKEKDKLRLDDHFVQYFPDFPFPDITIQQLLNHTSGLPEYELFDTLVEKEPSRIFTNRDVIPALKLWSKGLYFKPGDDWRYSSMNYCLLAILIEKLSGETLQGYLTRHIFTPAGMHQTYLENLLIKKTNPDRTVNYEYPTYYASRLLPVDSIPDDHTMIFNLGGFSGQGGLTSTAEDLLRFDKAFFSGKLISANDLGEALTPVKLNNGQTAHVRDSFGDLGASGYGLGWFILNDSTKGKVVWHDGGRPGISTVHLHNLRTDQTIILLENAAGDPHAPAAYAYHLLNEESTQSPRVSLIRIYSQTLVNEGANAAVVKLESLRLNPAYKMPENFEWVNLGYQLLFGKTKNVPLGVEALKTASLLYPDNWYVSQAYAAALEQSGNKELAILMYKKCIAENAQADYAVGRLKALQSK
jgi:CubicO group peptidase (beta-lactamase class C family)